MFFLHHAVRLVDGFIEKGLTRLLCRWSIKFGMIGNTVTRRTRTCSQEGPSAGRAALMCRSSSIPLELLLGLTYVAALRLMRDRGGDADTRQTSSVIPSDGLWEETTVGDVLDTAGGRLCYVYE